MAEEQGYVIHYNVPTKGITSLSFHPNGKRLLVSSRTGGVLLYNIEKQNRPFAFQSKSFSPVRSCVSPDGNAVYGASREGKIAMWKIHNQTPSAVKTAHSSMINDMDMWQKTGMIITASNDKSIKLWAPNLDFITSFPGHNSQVTACSCCPTADIILSGDNSGQLTLWDARASASGPIWTKSMRRSGRNSISSVNFDHTGVLFCVSTEDGNLSVWDMRNPDETICDDHMDPDVIQSHKVPSGNAIFHPRKPLILCAGSDETPKIVDTKMAAVLYSFEGHSKKNCACAWSPNGKMFATADEDGVVIVWNMPRNKIIPTILSRAEQVSVAPSAPPPAALTPEVLLCELELMNQHAQKLNEHLIAQEKRLTSLAANYPSVSAATYEC